MKTLFFDFALSIIWCGILNLALYMKQFAIVSGTMSTLTWCLLRQSHLGQPQLLLQESFFTKLGQSGFCCFLNSVNHGIFRYSYDNVLLATTKYALQKMQQICRQFSSSQNPSFSTYVNPIPKPKMLKITLKASSETFNECP
jgi:hypothetical protein